MQAKRVTFLTSLLLFFLMGCGTKDKKNPEKSNPKPEETITDTTAKVTETQVEEIKKDTFRLNEENAIDFFFDYAKGLKEDKVRLTTSLGSFTIQLYDNVPYHKANFIYLTKKGYFDNTQFHRVVPDFIIQGGNSDDKETSTKRKAIGRYLLPPDTRKGHKHHRGNHIDAE